MLIDKEPSQKRKSLRKKLDSGTLLRFPGVFTPIVAKLIEEIGFDGVYISGAVISNELGLPDIGLTTLSEVAYRGETISKATNLPTIIDIDTGFGEPMNVARTIQEMEVRGVCGCHLEDQINPKRCGHLDNKQLVSTEEMVRKVQAAKKARKDPNFLIIARTDSRASEGLDSAIDRANAYVAAGADIIFPEALKDGGEFQTFKREITAPILANMTEFGKSELLTVSQLESAGVSIVIYPVTTMRLALHAIETGLKVIHKEGTQANLLDKMQTRKSLYELLGYEKYNEFDSGVFNFKF